MFLLLKLNMKIVWKIRKMYNLMKNSQTDQQQIQYKLYVLTVYLKKTVFTTYYVGNLTKQKFLIR